MNYWKFKHFHNEQGLDLIEEWLKGLSPEDRAKIEARFKLLSGFKEKSLWKRPFARKLQGMKKGIGIWEIRVDSGGILYRPLGCFGPGEDEFTVLIDAIEVSTGVFNPRRAPETAQKRFKLFIKTGDISVDKDKLEYKEKLMVLLKDKRYRDAFVSEYLDAGISFQIRALRKREGWTQKELSEQTGMKQERISVAENPNYSRFNIKTLKRIASAFEVAFIGRFVPISELVDWVINLSSESLAPVRFEKDPYFNQPEIKGSTFIPKDVRDATTNIIDVDFEKKERQKPSAMGEMFISSQKAKTAGVRQ